MRSRRWMYVVAVLASVGALGACGQDSPEADDVDLAHIHGLGVNPADGQLYVASHHGVFRVGEGRPEQVAGRTQDFMGFTVIGPDHFLGSGHPAPGDREQPPQLGLIESTDAAQTWQVLSLSGEADFHAMEAKGGRVYGYDSVTGQILVSSDMRSWDRRTEGGVIDLAISPDNPDEVLATTRNGLARSTDGARTFTLTGSAPALVLVDWPRTDLTVGVGPDGAAHTSSDGGAHWTARGRVPGSPRAMATHAETDVYVATDEAIYRSADGGQTFEAILHLQGNP
ncbi:MAG: F510_1955 family glycosylhydrolase [Mycobacterium sp.]